MSRLNVMAIIIAAAIIAMGSAHGSSLAATPASTPETRAARDLFGGNPKTDGAEIYSRSQILVSGPLEIRSRPFYLVVLGTAQADCHACEAPLSAALYAREESGAWTLYAKAVNFASIGSWGELPGEKNRRLDYVETHVAGGGFLILLNDGYGNQGFYTAGKDILAFEMPGRWRSLGAIPTHEDNSGTACDEGGDKRHRRNRSADSDDADTMRCYAWTGTVTPQFRPGEPYPALIVNAKGTRLDDDSGIVPARRLVYRLKGDKYVEASDHQ